MIQPLVLVPVKRLRLAKSRIHVPDRPRRVIAQRLVEHTLTSVAACAGGDSLAVVTADPDVSRFTASLGGRPIPDPHQDLNSSLNHALRLLTQTDPARTVLVLVSDLPHLTLNDLAFLLWRITDAESPQHVADLEGTGTTAVSIRPGHRQSMLFGPRSAQRFRAAGWQGMDEAPIGLRADLDTAQDLHDLGLPAAILPAQLFTGGTRK